MDDCDHPYPHLPPLSVFYLNNALLSLNKLKLPCLKYTYTFQLEKTKTASSLSLTERMKASDVIIPFPS